MHKDYEQNVQHEKYATRREKCPTRKYQTNVQHKKMHNWTFKKGRSSSLHEKLGVPVRTMTKLSLFWAGNLELRFDRIESTSEGHWGSSMAKVTMTAG